MKKKLALRVVDGVFDYENNMFTIAIIMTMTIIASSFYLLGMGFV